MSRVPVWVADETFHGAVAQLAGRVRPADRPEGAVCIVSADGPPDLIAEAARLGSAIVLTQPWGAAPDVVETLGVAAVPVIVHRARLRADHVAESAGADEPRLVAGDVQSGPAEFAAAVTDAIGWIRALCGGPLALRAVSGSSSGALAAFEGPAGTPATLLATRLRAPARPALAVHGVSSRAVDVTVDDAAGIRLVRLRGAEADQIMAPRWETVGRMSLRRALEALAGAASTDLDDLAHDRRLAAAVLATTS